MMVTGAALYYYCYIHKVVSPVAQERLCSGEVIYKPYRAGNLLSAGVTGSVPLIVSRRLVWSLGYPPLVHRLLPCITQPAAPLLYNPPCPTPYNVFDLVLLSYQ